MRPSKKKEVREIKLQAPPQRGDIWVLSDRIYLETGRTDSRHHRTFISIFPDEVSAIPTLAHETAQSGLLLYHQAIRYRRVDSPAAVISFEEVRLRKNGLPLDTLDRALMRLMSFFINSRFPAPERLVKLLPQPDGTVMVAVDLSYDHLNKPLAGTPLKISCTDSRLAVLPKLAEITRLDLSGANAVSRDALDSLLRFNNLQLLDLRSVYVRGKDRAPITEADVLSFLHKHPSEKIEVIGGYAAPVGDKVAHHMKIKIGGGRTAQIVHINSPHPVWLGFPGKWGYFVQVNDDRTITYQAFDDVRSGGRKGFRQTAERSVSLGTPRVILTAHEDRALSVYLPSLAEEEDFVIGADHLMSLRAEDNPEFPGIRSSAVPLSLASEAPRRLRVLQISPAEKLRVLRLVPTLQAHAIGRSL